MKGLTNTGMNKKNFNRDIQLEIRFKRVIKAILGNQFIVQDRIEDLENGTDFLLLKMTPFKIGVRLRRYKYFKNYHHEFTLRWSRPSGVKTEIHKIREGLVDYIFYGFVDPKEKQIIQYFIGDLIIFKKNEPEGLIKPNNPPDSELSIYRISQLPKSFIIKFWQAREIRSNFTLDNPD